MRKKLYQYQYYGMGRTGEYKTGMNESSKYGMGKYGHLWIMERVANIRIYYWKYIGNVMGMW